MKIEEKIENLISEELNKNGFRIINVKYVKESGHNFLRIVIDKDEVVNVDSCLVATKIINNILDNKHLIEDEYILDVCSYEKGGNK